MLSAFLLSITVVFFLYAFAPLWRVSYQRATVTDSKDEMITSQNLLETLSDLHLDYALEKISKNDFDLQKQSIEKELNANREP